MKTSKPTNLQPSSLSVRIACRSCREIEEVYLACRNEYSPSYEEADTVSLLGQLSSIKLQGDAKH